MNDPITQFMRWFEVASRDQIVQVILFVTCIFWIPIFILFQVQLWLSTFLMCMALKLRTKIIRLRYKIGKYKKLT